RQGEATVVEGLAVLLPQRSLQDGDRKRGAQLPPKAWRPCFRWTCYDRLHVQDDRARIRRSVNDSTVGRDGKPGGDDSNDHPGGLMADGNDTLVGPTADDSDNDNDNDKTTPAPSSPTPPPPAATATPRHPDGGTARGVGVRTVWGGRGKH